MNLHQAIKLALLVDILGHPLGTHKHKCHACGSVWEHGDDMATRSKAEFDEAHTCARCGAWENEKYFGDDP